MERQNVKAQLGPGAAANIDSCWDLLGEREREKD